MTETYQPGQRVWYKPERASFEDEVAWEVTFVREDEEGYVICFEDGGCLTVCEVSTERPKLRKAIPQPEPAPAAPEGEQLAEWEKELLRP